MKPRSFHQALSDLDVVGLTEFGERFCKAVVGDVSGLYEGPVWRAG
jgi:hypothetical protein